MSSMSFQQQQKTSQIQSQVMSQQQIMTLKLLQMGSQDLRNEIYSQLEENPALELVSDPFSDGISKLRKGNLTTSSVHSGSVSAQGKLDADNYQKMLESSPDERETLQDSLLHQLNMISLSSREHELCEKLIGNLDEKGFHLLAPVSLLDSSDPAQTEALLEKCIAIVQHFEPAGICVQNVTESLLLQANLKKDAPSLALFLLNNHLDLLANPSSEKVYRKILQWLEEQEKLSFRTPEIFEPEKEKLTVKEVEKAVQFVQSLDPFPARKFGASKAQFIRPDVYVTLNSGILEKENVENGLIYYSDESYFRVILADDTIPHVQISPDFENLKLTSQISEGEQKNFLKLQITSAQNFINTLNFRQQIILRSCSFLVKNQLDFFKNGPGHLHPLTQRQFAEVLGVHESSVSRLADSKFIHCDWGIFPIKYFFTSSVTKKTVQVVAKSEEELVEKTNEVKTESVSSDTVKLEIEKILKAQKPGEKRLSDQKLSDMLAEKGYQVARRTVAKYRSQLNIASSYDR